MAFSKFERKRCEKIVGAFVEKRRPPIHVRTQVDLGFRIQGQSVEIFEVRPAWNDPKRKIESPVAKATYVKTKDLWKIYWKRADNEWQGYGPMREVDTSEDFLKVVDADPYGCFFG